jgi:hypothetical protein
MRNYKSVLAIIVTGMIYIMSIYAYKPYDAMYHQSEGDAFGYYVYLPAFFIHHDLADLHKTMTAKYNHCMPGVQAKGNFQNKYFAGTAFLQAPFFLAAHVVAGWLHERQDGFSMPYMYGAILSCMSYVLLGLILLMLILRRYFTDSVVALVILIIGLATNIYYMVVNQPPFCHPFLFFWYSLLLFFTIRYYETLRSRFILLIGFTCGMIILTRPNEMYVVLIPLLWGLCDKQTVLERLKLLRAKLGYVIGAGIIMALCITPQLLYWKVSVGHFIYYSYQGEKFDFLHPHIWDGFFSFNNGWLVYCPIMFFALAGIWRSARDFSPALMPLMIFGAVHVYVIYSWWCWFYMGSYGSRPMIEVYPLLSFPLAYTVSWFLESWYKKTVLAIVFVFCSGVIFCQTYQSYKGFFNSEISNWRFNLVTLGKTKLTYDESIVLDTKEFQPQHPVFVKLLTENDFEDANLPGSDTTVHTSGHRSICVRMDSTFMGYKATLRQTGAKRGQWIKATISCMAKEPTNHIWHLSLLAIVCTEKGHKSLKWRILGLQNKIDNPNRELWHFPTNEWGRLYFYSQIPDDMTEDDDILVYVEHKQGTDVYIDDLKVELYKNN